MFVWFLILIFFLDVRYDGKDNLLSMARDYKIKYRCRFDVSIIIVQYFRKQFLLFQVYQFPFDNQLCRGTISLPWKNNDTVVLMASKNPILYSGLRDLTTFRIKFLFANSTRTADGSRFSFYIKLERIWASIFITTFLQTFVLWFLVYLTLFIDIEDFNNRFMGAITGFLVFASLSSSLMSSLPKSSGFKLADIWLLFFMFNINFVIIMHILIEFLQRRNPKDIVIQNKFKYPGTVTSKSGQRSNTTAKVIFPIMTSFFLGFYFLVSNVNLG